MNKHLLSLLALASVPVLAATPINEQALQACSFIENDFNRLLCYDNTIAGKSLTQPAHKQPQQSVKANVKADTAVATAPVTTKAKEFGLEHKKITENSEETISSTIANVKKAPYGELIITLENNQQWRQIGSDSLRLAEGDTVIISRGVFNSFLLKKADQNRSIRVKRTQ
jgi:DMSO/TMAO reductase YedYZ molybdopterin-dependent catalytic subunit